VKASREIVLLRLVLSGHVVRERTFVYQAASATTGLTVTFVVYQPDGTQDTDQGGIATEIGSTGRYLGCLKTNAPSWFVMIHDSAGGEAIKQFDN
jgi:hypothetical protein